MVLKGRTETEEKNKPVRLKTGILFCPYFQDKPGRAC